MKLFAKSRRFLVVSCLQLVLSMILYKANPRRIFYSNSYLLPYLVIKVFIHSFFIHLTFFIHLVNSCPVDYTFIYVYILKFNIYVFMYKRL
jgi:hypothetical protein